MVSVDKINRSMFLPANRDRVWQAITQPEELCQWFAQECEFTLEIGSDIILKWDNRAISRGVIEVIDPPIRFSFR